MKTPQNIQKQEAQGLKNPVAAEVKIPAIRQYLVTVDISAERSLVGQTGRIGEQRFLEERLAEKIAEAVLEFYQCGGTADVQIEQHYEIR